MSLTTPSEPGTAADEFAVRYYRWSLADCRRELQEDFPLLRTVRSSLAIRALAYLQSFAGEDRLRVAMALVRRCHRRALEITEESWSARDEEIQQDYVSAARILRPEEEWYRQALLHDPGKLRLDRRRFLAAAQEQLAPVLGSGAPFSTKHEWRYETPIGQWRLVTFVDVGGTAHQLTYDHRILGTGPRPLKEGISVCGWLGVGGGHTQWNQLTQPDTPAAARALARICAHFLQAAPDLVAGLVPSGD